MSYPGRPIKLIFAIFVYRHILDVFFGTLPKPIFFFLNFNGFEFLEKV